MRIAAPITCMANNGSIALAGCADGALKLWAMADGQLLDSGCAHPASKYPLLLCFRMPKIEPSPHCCCCGRS